VRRVTQKQLPKKLSQRADFTYKFNLDYNRHNWLRLTPAFSLKIVDSIIDNKKDGLKILDPFSGTATTPLSAIYKKREAIGLDINPFLVWFGNVKIATYSKKTLGESIDCSDKIVNLIKNKQLNPIDPPPIFNIHRWWDGRDLDYLCKIKSGIESAEIDTGAKNLLYVAFCRTIIDISHVSFSHQSMSFNTNPGENLHKLLDDYIHPLSCFSQNTRLVIKGASENPLGSAKIINDDARTMKKISKEKFDLLITSPPYPNRMSYIRELRPYMYWLEYLKEAREASDLDWDSIGGTWGVATSRLLQWKPKHDRFIPDYLTEIIENIRSYDGKSGVLLANYVEKYFEDMWFHFCSMKRVMNDNSEVHYIIGNSKFYDFTVPTERVFSDMLNAVGVKKSEITPIRKRNSKKELFEFKVSGFF
jgi:hypothetical protein